MRTRSMVALGLGVALWSIPLSGQRQGTAQNETAAPAKAVWPPQRLPDGQPDVQGFWGPVQNGTQSLTNPMAGLGLVLSVVIVLRQVFVEVRRGGGSVLLCFGSEHGWRG